MGLPRRLDALKGSAPHTPDKDLLLLRIALLVQDQLCCPSMRSHAHWA